MPLVGTNLIADEQTRLANVVSAIPAADLWSERQGPAGNYVGPGDPPTATNDGRQGFRELPYTHEDLLDFDGDVHRAFYLLPEATEPMDGAGRSASNDEQTVRVRWRLQLGRRVGGGAGSRAAGDWRQGHLAALQDAERIRQEVEHPRNFSAGGAAGVTANRTALVTWLGTGLRTNRDRCIVVADMRLESHLLVVVEAA